MKKSILALAVFLVSCLPSTYDELRGNNAGTLSFSSEMPATDVWSLVFNQYQLCLDSGFQFRTAQSSVTGTPDAMGQGVIKLLLHGPLGDDLMLAIDIQKNANGLTDVLVTRALDFAAWRRSADLVKAWVVEGSTECR